MIRAGIAGMGTWGQKLVSSVQGKSGKISFVAGATGRKEKALPFAQAQKIELRDKLEDLLADPQIDAVVLATPHSMHADQIVAAAKAGKHVFCEKPFTLTKAQAETALKACREAGVVCAVGFNRRFLPAMVKIREMMTAGELGTILHIEGLFSNDGAYKLQPEAWRSSRQESPAGMMAGLGIHSIDSMIHLMGPIVEVEAMSQRRALPVDIDDTTAMLLRFESGATGYLGTFASPFQWRLQVIGSTGWAEMHSETKLFYRLAGQDEQFVDYGTAFDSLHAELESFADCVANKTPFWVTPEQAINGAAVFEAVPLSAQKKEKVKI